MIRRPPRSTRTDTLFPYTTLFRSLRGGSGRGLQNFLALLPVAGAQFVRLKRIEHAKRFLRVAALVETVHRHMLDHIVRIDDEGGAISDACILGDDAKRVGELDRKSTRLNNSH